MSLRAVGEAIQRPCAGLHKATGLLRFARKDGLDETEFCRHPVNPLLIGILSYETHSPFPDL